MKPHFINQLNNFICGWYIDTSLCDDIRNYFDALPAENKFDGGVASPYLGGFTDSVVKKSTESVLSDNFELYKAYQIELQKCVDQYIAKYERSASLGEFKSTSITKIQHYKPSEGFFDYHCERFGSELPYSTRHLVYMTYLNDVQDAGETEFLYQNIKIKAEKGLTIIWPAEWTHTHRGVTSMTEHKYIVTGWFNFI
jgi:hypothetical protein